MQKLTQSQCAALLGVSTRRLRQLSRESDPPPDGSQGYDPTEFGVWMSRKSGGSIPGLETERIRLTKAQADEKELQVAELRGELISTPEALLQVETMVGAMRARLLAMPTKIATVVATSPTEIVKAQTLIREHVYEALTEIASATFREKIESTLHKQRSKTKPARRRALKKKVSTA